MLPCDATRFGARARVFEKVVLWRVLGRVDWRVFVLGSKLVKLHVARQDLYLQCICCTDKR